MRKKWGKCIYCGKPADLDSGMCDLCEHIAGEWFEQQIDQVTVRPELGAPGTNGVESSQESDSNR